MLRIQNSELKGAEPSISIRFRFFIPAMFHCFSSNTYSIFKLPNNFLLYNTQCSFVTCGLSLHPRQDCMLEIAHNRRFHAMLFTVSWELRSASNQLVGLLIWYKIWYKTAVAEENSTVRGMVNSTRSKTK